jgi:tRNA A37 methylthiotransferase MiaB
MKTKSWITALASALHRNVAASGTNKIRVYPVSLGQNQQPLEFWSGFYALGCLAAYAKVHQDGALNEHFEFQRITPLPATVIPTLVEAIPRDPGIFLLSSYVWNHAANATFAQAIKQRAPGSLVIVGGPHIARAQAQCEEFFAHHPSVDVAVRHDGEVTLAEILSAVARSGVEPAALSRVDLSNVEGLTFRRDGALVRTPDRGRLLDLAMFPSPYTTGEFDHWIDGKYYMPVETNRGCPYGCTFCDWGAATLSKIAKMSMERVLGEVEFAAKHRIDTIGFCDANFGILQRDVDIARHVLDMKERCGYPREVGYTNAKTASSRLTDIVKLWSDGGLISSGQISMQTTDEQILDNVKRSNIKMTEYRKMITFFHKENIPAVSDIMLGLPGQTFATCKKDLQFCFDHKVLAMIFATSVMPNAPMADEDYRRKFQITVGSDGFVESTYSFTPDEYARMFDLCLAYKLFVKHGLLKYFLYFVQIERGVLAMDFLERWLASSAAQPERYPISARIRGDLLDRDRSRGSLKDWLSIVWTDEQAGFLFDSMAGFQAEMIELLEREFGVRLEGSDLEAVLVANREVMPKKGRALPTRVRVPHDVAGYFDSLRTLPSIGDMPADHVPLKARGPGLIELGEQAASTSYAFADIISLVGKLELASNVRI